MTGVQWICRLYPPIHLLQCELLFRFVLFDLFALTLSSHLPKRLYCFRSNWWGEPDANSFRVRGKTYKTDNKKVNAGPSIFHLFATDIIETDEPIHTGMCLHPKERVQLALQREREKAEDGVASPVEMPPFVFAVIIMVSWEEISLSFHCSYDVQELTLIAPLSPVRRIITWYSTMQWMICH